MYMWDRKELKAVGKAAFRANYWKCVLVGLILIVFFGGNTAGSGSNGAEQTESLSTQTESFTAQLESFTPLEWGIFAGVTVTAIVIGILIHMFLFYPLQVGCYAFFKENVEKGGAQLGTIRQGFRSYGRNFVTLLLRELYIILWCILLVIPGLMKAYSYRMVPYILAEEPELSASEVLARSKQMMDGNRWECFKLDLSFLGWEILGILTCGVVTVFWTRPYEENTMAALYLKLKA